MSDDSFLTNLTNKVIYKAHKLAYDPDANEFAKKEGERKKKESEEKQTKVKQESNVSRIKDFLGINKTQQSSDASNNITDGDPNSFSFKRLLKRTSLQFTETVQWGILPFVAIIFAMLVANSCIIYSIPIRIIMFIFTLLLCLFFPFYTIVLFVYYTFMGIYSYYMNNLKSNQTKKNYLPVIFALLPISTYNPDSQLLSALMYPFTYPKTEDDKIQLNNIMKEYSEDLEKSFKNYDKYSTVPMFKNAIDIVKKRLSDLHPYSIIENE